jgi:hypothetical protein
MLSKTRTTPTMKSLPLLAALVGATMGVDVDARVVCAD